MNFPSKTRNSNLTSSILLILVIIVTFLVVLLQVNSISNIRIHGSVQNVITHRKAINAPRFDTNKHSLTEPDSLWVVVNKSNHLNPSDYVPEQLVNVRGGIVNSRMIYDLNYMFDAAEKAGISLTIASSYRSYNYQVNLYSNYVNSYGQALTDTFSARPGYSEHQTGLAIDFGSINAPACNISDCYAETTAGEWLANHALEYGFLLRYPIDKQSVTGYKFEPWHYRYIGHYLADEMKKQSITTLEEFFNVSGGAVYQP